jgi:hypothetical protein
MLTNRRFGYLWLVTMAILFAVGGYSDTRWMMESALAGAAGFLVGRIFPEKDDHDA